MAKLTIDVTESQLDWLTAQAKLMGADRRPSDWVEATIAACVETMSSETQRALLDGLQSGSSVPADDAFWKAEMNRIPSASTEAVSHPV